MNEQFLLSLSVAASLSAPSPLLPSIPPPDFFAPIWHVTLPRARPDKCSTPPRTSWRRPWSILDPSVANPRTSFSTFRHRWPISIETNLTSADSVSSVTVPFTLTLSDMIESTCGEPDWEWRGQIRLLIGQYLTHTASHVCCPAVRSLDIRLACVPPRPCYSFMTADRSIWSTCEPGKCRPFPSIYDSW